MATVIEVGDQDVLLEMRELTRKAMVTPAPVVGSLNSVTVFL
jgi:hypothetical protein